MFKVRWSEDSTRDKGSQARMQANLARELRAAGMRQVGTDDEGFELWARNPDYKPSKARLQQLFPSLLKRLRLYVDL